MFLIDFLLICCSHSFMIPSYGIYHAMQSVMPMIKRGRGTDIVTAMLSETESMVEVGVKVMVGLGGRVEMEK